MEKTVSESFNKWILKLDEKHEKISNQKSNMLRSIDNIGNLFHSDYDYDQFFL